MRYLLIVVGLLGVLLGLVAIAYGPTNANPPGWIILQVGAVGLATVDIVEAIKAKCQ